MKRSAGSERPHRHLAEAVLVPVDPEPWTREARQRDGIPIAEDIRESVTELTMSLGLSDLMRRQG